jgi:hypothetical protein
LLPLLPLLLLPLLLLTLPPWLSVLLQGAEVAKPWDHTKERGKLAGQQGQHVATVMFKRVVQQNCELYGDINCALVSMSPSMGHRCKSLGKAIPAAPEHTLCTPTESVANRVTRCQAGMSHDLTPSVALQGMACHFERLTISPTCRPSSSPHAPNPLLPAVCRQAAVHDMPHV